MDKERYELGQKLTSILMPHAYQTRRRAIENRLKFVHYTTAESGLKIIRSREMWLRDARCMNDYTEVTGGYQKLRNYFSVQSNFKQFLTALDKCQVGAATAAVDLFDMWWPHTPINTYMACLSEHDESENKFGRLSMWRAYAKGNTGVGIVLNIPLEQPLEKYTIFLSPAGYLGSIEGEIANILGNIETNIDFLRAIPRDLLVTGIFMMLTMAAVSLKHPGFHEEREWRVVHLPKQYPSSFITSSVEIIGGVPQSVFKLPLKQNEEPESAIMALPRLIDKVIVGPSSFPGPVAAAFISALKEIGIEDAENRVVVSDIPLRT